MGLRCTATLVVLMLLSPSAVFGVLRTCGDDPVANTANVLCAAPSGPCTAGSVTVSSAIEVTDAGCLFDLGGRTLTIEKTFEMTGLGFITVMNAGDITITSTGQLKARGDFVKPDGVVVQGGAIGLTSTGTITHWGAIDVSGDGAGSVDLEADGDVLLQNGSVIQANGISSTSSEGERYTDGGSFVVASTDGSITVVGTISLRGANQATGGSLDFVAARDINIQGATDATGGGSDGGEVWMTAGDNLTITKKIDVSSRLGGGYGGSINLEAGVDWYGGVVPGGAITVNDTVIEFNGSDAETFGGDGGELVMSAQGRIGIIGTRAVIRANGGTLFDGSGGTIDLDSGDANLYRIGPTDGDIVVEGQVVARSGGLGGDGGILEASTGDSLTLSASITFTGKDTGGEVVADAGAAILVDGVINVGATNALGDGGYVDLVAGFAANATLTLADDILAASGASSGGGQSITLAGCELTVNDGVRVNGQGGVSINGIAGGSDIDLIARRPMQLGSNSQYLADPAGKNTATHPFGQDPVIGAGVVFNPPLIDNPTEAPLYPNCPVCGDGIRQAGEVCDKGAQAEGACCNDDCTAFTCPTPTPIRTMTPTPLPTATAVLSATATRTSTPSPTSTATALPTSLQSTTATPTATVSPTATRTPTATPTSAESATQTPSATGTVVVSTTPVATPSVDPTATPELNRLANLEVAKAAVKCQKEVEKAGGKYTSKMLSSLGKCTGGMFKCIQEKPGDLDCEAKASAKCASEVQKLAGEKGKLAASIEKKCTAGLGFVEHMRAPEGLDYGSLAPQCPLLDSLSAFVDCLTDRHQCEAAKLFRMQQPRGGELVRRAGVGSEQFPCLTDHGSGGYAGDASTGKAINKCAAAISKSGSKFVAKWLRSFEKCVDSVFTCLQTKPDPSGETQCLVLEKARASCSKGLMKAVAEEQKFRGAVEKKCGAGVVDFALLGAPEGANLTAIADECVAYGVTAVGSLEDFKQCLVLQHKCVGGELLRFVAPRAGAMLDLVGQAADFCPAAAAK